MLAMYRARIYLMPDTFRFPEWYYFTKSVATTGLLMHLLLVLDDLRVIARALGFCAQFVELRAGRVEASSALCRHARFGRRPGCFLGSQGYFQFRDCDGKFDGIGDLRQFDQTGRRLR